MKRFPWLLTLCTALALAVLVSLGVWQLRRLEWKEGLIARAERKARLPVAPIAVAFADPDGPEFRRVTADCPGISTAPFVELRSIHDGQAGVRLISACKPASFTFSLLVDRGFIADEVKARPPVRASSEPQIVTGEVRFAPLRNGFAPDPDGRVFYDRNNMAMARVLGAGTVPEHFVYATRSTNPELAALQPSAPPPAFSNNHLGYAATWFGLALVLAGVYIALVIRKLKP